VARVRAVVDFGLSKAAAARRFNTTPKTVAKWVGRLRALGVEGLRDRSSRPLSSASQTPLPTCTAIEVLRRRRYTGKQIAVETKVRRRPSAASSSGSASPASRPSNRPRRSVATSGRGLGSASTSTSKSSANSIGSGTARLSPSLRAVGPSPHPDQTLYTQEQPQGRAIHPDQPARMGLCVCRRKLKPAPRALAQLVTPL
jgi:hypothetical protein